jgi:hypothetical protein
MEILYAHAPAIALTTIMIGALLWSGAASNAYVRWGAGIFETLVLIEKTDATTLPHYAVCIAAGVVFMVGLGAINEIRKSIPQRRPTPTVEQLFDFENIGGD